MQKQRLVFNYQAYFLFFQINNIRDNQHMLIFILPFLALVLQSTATNLICNGDFEAYVLTQVADDSAGNPQKFDYIPNNYSCWYDSLGPTIEVCRYTQKLAYPTQVMQFVSFNPRTVCQNLTFQINGTYELNYTMIQDPVLVSGSLIAQLDGVQLTNITFVSPNYVIRKSVRFISNKTNSVLCFNTRQTYKLFDALSQFQYSPEIDNVSLVLVIPPPNSNNSNQTNNNTSNTTKNITTNTTTNTTNTTSNITTNSTTNTSNTNTTTVNNITNTTSNTTTTPIENSTYSNTTSNNTTQFNTTTSTNSSTSNQIISNNNSTNTTNLNNTNNNNTNTYNTSINSTNNTSTNSTSNQSQPPYTNNTNPTQPNTSNSTNTTTSPPIPISSKVTQIFLTIIFTTQSCSYDNSIILSSNFKPMNYGLSLQAFHILVVTIKNQIQENVIFWLTEEGCLSFKFYPPEIYDTLNPSHLTVYYPVPLKSSALTYHVTVLVDGQAVIFTRLSQFQLNALKTVNPIAKSLAKIVYNAYLILNSSGCSYFVLSLIGFWNLSLMYSFLLLKSLPVFALSFITQLLTILYSRVSIKSTIYSIFHLSEDNSALDFRHLSSVEKIPQFRNEYAWFSSYGLTSNAMNNNFESLFLLGFSLLKFVLFKLFASRLPSKYKQKLYMSWSQLFYKFVEEMSGFVPFFTISAFSTFLNMAEQNGMGKINNGIQVVIFSFISLLPILTFIVRRSRLSKFSRARRIQKAKKIKLQKFGLISSLVWVLFSISLPIFLILGVKVLFFIVITPIILYRAILAFKNLRFMKKKSQKIGKIIDNMIWIVYHFTFMFYCLIDLIPALQKMNLENAIKICGFVVIMCIFGGGLLDLLFSLINILLELFRFIKKLVRQCKKSNKVANEKNDTSKKTCKTTPQTSDKKEKRNLTQNQISVNPIQKNQSKRTLNAILNEKYQVQFIQTKKDISNSKMTKQKPIKTTKNIQKIKNLLRVE